MKKCGAMWTRYVRHQAYPIAQDLTRRELERVLTAIAEEFNERFDVPLFPNELKYISSKHYTLLQIRAVLGIQRT